MYMQRINYDVFWRLSFFLDIKSIENLSNTCRTLKLFIRDLEPILVRRMFPDNHNKILLNEPRLFLYKFYMWNHFQQSTFLERIIIFTINQSKKLRNRRSKLDQYLFNFFNKIITQSRLDLCNLNYIFIHGNRNYKKLLIEKMFNSRVVICNFNLQNLFNAILILQDLHYLDEFYLNFKNAHIIITRNHIRQIIMSKNIIFFDKLVDLFIGDFIKLNLYQSCIKECNLSPFQKYISN
jgi:hypothetical protein